MSTHKHIDRICCAALGLALLLTLALYACAAQSGGAAPAALGYEDRLFDTARVHTIDIVLDDWDGFLATAEAEEYTACAVVIDGEACRNVGLRAKGNTSLTQVAASGSARYSFKLEFDHYEDGRTWHGLDKLSLNNLIQDATCMKDHLVYRLMADFGAAAPLSSYAWLTVNGEDWGLYLAVEGIEDSFLARNYGRDTGELYKPDSADVGGGRGNGRAFAWDGAAPQTGGASDPAEADGAAPGPAPGSEGRAFPGGQPDAAPNGEIPQMPDGETPQRPDGEVPQMPGGMPQRPGMADGADGRPGRGAEGSLRGGAGSADVKLQYIDDDPDSYPDIFDNAKTDVTAADKARLIAALKTLSGADPEAALDTDAVLRYFVVHDFVCNDDSYTGQMIHNYYLYEQDGRLAMLPWDYNLAFGGFGGGDAASAVNDPIDEPLADRPMQSWIFADAAATAQYHALYADFLQRWFADGALDALVAEIQALIAPYVQKDPTAFCTPEQFETGVAALRQFLALRAESVQGQLAGTVPATTAAQQQDPGALVDTGSLDLSAMGDMGMGGGFGRRQGAAA